MTTTRKRLKAPNGEMIAPENLSAAVQNYISSLYKLKEEGIRTTPALLAEYIRHLPATEGLGTSLPSVIGMLRRMVREGLVEIASNKDVHLTEQGVRISEALVRRHRLAECMVVDMLGMELYQACLEGHQLEHAISPELERRIQVKLGGPTISPFGKPIPGSGYVEPTEEGIPLDQAVLAKLYHVDRIPETEPEIIRFLVDNGVVPGAEISVVEAGAYRGVLVFRTPKAESSVGYQVASHIWVRSPS